MKVTLSQYSMHLDRFSDCGPEMSHWIYSIDLVAFVAHPLHYPAGGFLSSGEHCPFEAPEIRYLDIV